MYVIQCCAEGVSARFLKEEIRRLGYDVVGCDCRPCHVETAMVQNAGRSPKGFVADLETLVGDHKDTIVIPHNQDEALVLSAYTGGRFRVFLSPRKTIKEILDKSKFMEICGDIGAATPFEVLGRDQVFQFFSLKTGSFLKPISGCGAANTFGVDSLPYEFIMMPEFPQDFEEYTIDVVFHNPVCGMPSVLVDWCARRRIKAHGGICVDAEVVGQPSWLAERLNYLTMLFHALDGPFANQGFRNPRTDELFFTDCNHRFGGGVGMSIAAGWRGVENFFRCINGLEPVKSEIRHERYRRYFMQEKVR